MSRISNHTSLSVGKLNVKAPPVKRRNSFHGKTVAINKSPLRRRNSFPLLASTEKTYRPIHTTLKRRNCRVLSVAETINEKRILKDIKGKSSQQMQQLPLTQEERKVVTEYTCNSLFAHAYRSYLMSGNTHFYRVNANEVKAECKLLSQGIAKIPDYKGIVFHGSMPNVKAVAKMNKGDLVTNPGFLSSSVSREFASNYAFYDLDEGEKSAPDEQPTIFVINSKTGKNIANLAAEDCDAAEVLFQPDSVFKVTKKIRKEEENLTLIYLEEHHEPIEPKQAKNMLTGKPHHPVFLKSLFESDGRAPPPKRSPPQ